MNYIDTILSLTSDREAPESYYKWAGISTLCAVCRDNIYVPTRYGPVYPNMYILLVGPPATRKGHPCSLAYKLVSKVQNTKIVSGRTSIQALLPYLAEMQTLDNGTILKGASVYINSEELRTLFVDDPQVIGLLTDLYNFRETWAHNLVRLGGIAPLERLCVTLLAASNVKLLREVFTSSAVEGGLLSRTVLIMEESKKLHSSGIDSNINDAVEEKDLNINTTQLDSHLKLLAKKREALYWEKEAIIEYDEWYMSYSKGVESKGASSRTGIDGRIHENVLKLIAVLTVADYNLSMRISKRIVEEAIDTIMPLMTNYEKFAMETGSSSDHTPAMMLLTAAYNERGHSIDHKKFLRMRLGDINIRQLEEDIIPKLEQAGLIKTTSSSSGRGVSYKLTQMGIDMMEGKPSD